jgi:hypothetical protein
MEMVKKFIDEKRGLSGRYGSAAQSTSEAVAKIHETQVAAQTLALGALPAQPKLEGSEGQEWDVSKTYNPLMLVRRRLSKPDTIASYRVPEPSPLREDVPVWCRDMTSSGKAQPARATAVNAAPKPAVVPMAPTAAAVPIPATVPTHPSGPGPVPLTGLPPTVPPPMSPQGALPSTPSGVPPMSGVPAAIGLPTRPAHMAHNMSTSAPIPVPTTGHITLRPTTPDVPINPSEIEVSPRGIAPLGRGVSPISVPAPGYNPASVAPPTGPPKPRVVLRIPALGRSTPLVPAGQPTTGVPVGAPGVAPNPHGTHVPIMVPKYPGGPAPMAPNPMPPGARPVAVPGGPGVVRAPPSGPVPPQRGVPPHPLTRGPPSSFQPKVRVLSPGVTGVPPTTGIPTGPLLMPKGPGVAAPPGGNLVVRFNPGMQAAGVQPPKASVLGTLVNYCMKKFPTQVMYVRDIATKKEVPERQRIDMLRNMIQQLEPNAPILTMFMQAKK